MKFMNFQWTGQTVYQGWLSLICLGVCVPGWVYPVLAGQDQVLVTRKRIIGDAPQSAPTQNQDPHGIETTAGGIITVEAESRQLTFSVLDPNNRLVKDISASDFEVYDGGERQEVDVFTTGKGLPVMLAVVVDMSASQESLLPVEKRAVDVFFDSFFREGQDYGALLTFQGTTTLVTGLTSNLKHLKSALGRVEREQQFRDDEAGGMPELGSSLFDAIEITSVEILNGSASQSILSQTGTTATNQRTQRAIRKAICVLTDGQDTSSLTKLKDVIELAQDSGIAVFALGIGDRFRFGDVDQRLLSRLCDRTGGLAFFPMSEPELKTAFSKIVDELSSQYVAVYRPAGGSSDDTGFRNLKIVFPRRPELKAIHSDGYASGQ